MSNHAVLEVRVDALEEWKRDHSQEDDRRHESHEVRIQSLELSRARIMAYAAGAAAGGALIAQVLIWLLTKSNG
jgi:hypothetical protein